jgi:hypothetical protein
MVDTLLFCIPEKNIIAKSSIFTKKIHCLTSAEHFAIVQISQARPAIRQEFRSSGVCVSFSSTQLKPDFIKKIRLPVYKIKTNKQTHCMIFQLRITSFV